MFSKEPWVIRVVAGDAEGTSSAARHPPISRSLCSILEVVKVEPLAVRSASLPVYVPLRPSG